MRGMLKSKSPLTQLILVIGIALAGFFIVGLVGMLILSSISGMNITELSDNSKWKLDDPRTIMVIRGMQLIQFLSLFILPTWICAKLFTTDSRAYLGLKRPSFPSFYIIAILAMALSLPLVYWLGDLNRGIRFPQGLEDWFKTKEEEASRLIQALLQQRTLKDLLLNILFIAGMAAVGEELLFRGLLQRLIIKLFRNHWAGIIISAILFSAMHLQFYGFLPRLALGILLGLIYWYSGSLWVAMLAHFVYDAALITLVYLDPSQAVNENSVELPNPAILAIISVTAIAALMFWMKKRSGITYEKMYADDAIPVKNHPF